MKSFIFSLALMVTLFLFACNNQEKSAKPGEPKAASAQEHASHTDNQETKTISASFTDVDANAAGAIHGIIGQYLAVKNALASDNASEASKAAGAMGEVIRKVDKSFLTAEQKTAFDKAADIIGQQAAQIAGAGGDIARQRNAFFPLSESITTLARQFGGGKTLYLDYCPMARDNQGASWISEQKDIRNPYFGSGMLTCGSVKEMIQ